MPLFFNPIWRLRQKFMMALFFAIPLGCQFAEPMIRVADENAQYLVSAVPADVGINGELLRQSVSDLPSAAEHGLRSMLVLKDGKLVLEEYWNGYDRNTLQDIRSATKSITSLLVGIAIDRQFLGGVDEPLRKHLALIYSDVAALNRNITLDHLLTMRSGLACNDRDPQSPGQEDRIYRTNDWVRSFLELSSVYPAGDATHYCTAGVIALGRVIAEASKRPIPEFANEYLFLPLNIKDARWSDFDHHRQTDTGGHLFLRPRDMLKIGQLVLQKGMWNDRELVSLQWIAQSTQEHTRIDDGKAYGYLWWHESASHKGKQVTIVAAYGNGGQYIFVIPELGMVVVFTGGNYNSEKAFRPFQMMMKYILPAVNSSLH